jgi:phage minor structural protein, N-terminal domain protein|nr:MAG TPA: tail protein [Caudoviricetes sp.]
MIYLFNNKEELIHIIKEQDLIEFTHKIEINTFDAAEFELPIEAIDKEIIEQMRFFGFFVRGTQFGVFKAYEVTTTDNYVVKGLDRAESDLRTVRIIKDKRLQSVTADQALNVALEGTGYQLGEREGLTKVNKTNFYYISPREALVKIIEAFNCEFRVRYEFVENKIINRYIDLYHRQGSYSGVQFEYGNNALEVTMEEDSDNVVTALIGRGKGEESTDSEGNATGGYGRRIEFTDIVWTKASGKPIDKPAGQNYIVLNDDIENKGLYQNGELKHRWGVFVDEEIEDKEVLLQATYQELLRLNNPIRKYKASILDLRDDIWLGDRVAIVKDSAKLSFEARIFSITIDKLNFDQSEVELGDYETLKSQSQSSSLNAIKEAARELSEEQEAYNRKVQEMIDQKNAEIAEKMRVMRLDMDNGIEDAKNKAEKVKQEVAGTIDQKISGFKQTTDSEIAKLTAKTEEALEKAGTMPDTTTLSDEIKRQLLNSPDLARKVTETFANDNNGNVIYGKILQNIKTEFTPRATFNGFVGSTNSDLSNLMSRTGEAERAIHRQTVEFNKLTESNKLYERILGTSETGAPDKLSRLVMSSDIFQTEVGKYVTDDNNLIVNSETMDKNTLVNPRQGIDISVNDGVFTIKAQGLTSYNWSGFTLPIYVRKIYKGETYSLGFKYRIRGALDHVFNVIIKNHVLNRTAFTATAGTPNTPASDDWKEFQGTFYMSSDFEFGNNINFPFYAYISKNGWVEIKEIILVRGSNTGPYKPSQFDDAYKSVEATRTQVTQLAGSYAIRNLNSAGDIINGINFGADGTTRFVSKLTHISGDTLIDNAVIKSAMVDKLKTGNFESGSVTTQILASNAVTADKLLVDSAMINKLVSNQAFIRELTSQKAFITQLASIDISAEHIKGGRLSANNGSTVFDLDNGTLNLYSNTGTIRRIDDTSASQFIKFNQVGLVGEYLRDNKAARIVIGTNQDKTENTENSTFAGMRLWSGTKNDVKESLYELVGDRIIFYANGQYRSPWIIHNNTKDGNSYLIPMNEKGVKHNLGRGDKHFSKAYIDDLFIGKGSQNVGGYLWDILTCFGIIARYGWDLKNASVQSHIRSNFIDKYGFK